MVQGQKCGDTFRALERKKRKKVEQEKQGEFAMETEGTRPMRSFITITLRLYSTFVFY